MTLNPSASLSTTLRTFAAAGPIHGQLWLRVPAATTGTVRVQVNWDVAGKSRYFDLDLSTLTAGQWKRFWFDTGAGVTVPGTGLWTTGTIGNVTLQALPGNTGPVAFYAWGLDLTQVSIAAGAAVPDGVSFNDLGAEMYSWSVRKDVTNRNTDVLIDALQTPAIPASASTAPSGFCLAAEATPGGSLSWAAPFTAPRTLVTWVNDPASPTLTAKLYLSGATAIAPAQLCMSVTGVATPLCANVPAGWTAATKHLVTGCMSAAGEMRLYGDGAATPLGTATGSGTPDLAGGTLLVGGASTTGQSDSWNGYISRAAACYDGVSLADCR